MIGLAGLVISERARWNSLEPLRAAVPVDPVPGATLYRTGAHGFRLSTLGLV
ncbi:hypothetical protein [Dictyobacter vulcani]|uniref:hypothetical protein n=1 Tax=Dictyobacter vulcani TaxID=2607529 RepID=UPI001386666A|nr:hypothetical protein [Dictyobacter vulcani]